MNSEEHQSYHALITALGGDRQKLAAIRAPNGSWTTTLADFRKLHSGLDAEKEWEKLDRSGIRLVLFHDAEFPELLKEVADAPYGLYIKGKLPDAGTPTIGIVGTRKATSGGLTLAHKFASELSKYGVAVMSGLAMGIDTAAHKGTLAENGQTVAVLPSGLDKVYPPQNIALAEQILESGGALVSEYPPGSISFPSRFIERNRIVSGLSKGVLVIEAPKKSGALSTARFATEENRDVLAIPGPITHPNYVGSHELLKSGAGLVTDVRDILDALAIQPNQLPLKKHRAAQSATPEETTVIEALQSLGGEAAIDKITEITKLDPQSVNRLITFLLVKDIIRESGGGNFELII